MRRPGAGAVLGVSFAALAIGTLATAAPGTLAPELRAALGLTRAEIGLLTSLVFVGAILSSRRAGRLTDSAGPALVLGVAMAGSAVAVTLAASAPSGAFFMAAMLLVGIAYGAVNPPTNVVVAGRLARRRGFFLSLKQTGVPFGVLLAGAFLPPAAVLLGWRGALLLIALASMLVAAGTVFLRGAVAARAEDVAVLPAGAVGESVALGVFGFVMAGIQWSFITYLTLFLSQEHGFTLPRAGLALALAQALGALGRLTWGWLSDVPGRRVAILYGLALLSACSLGGLASGIEGPALWPIVAVSGFAIVGWNGAYHALLADRAGPGRVGRMSGDALAIVYGGPVVLPPLLGLVVDATGSWRVLWLVCAALVGAAAIMLRIAFGRRRRPLRRRRSRG